jgi:hypothetical protein
VEKLGLAEKVTSEEKAIEILTSRSIYPGSPFKVQWDKDKEATEKFIAQIQASLQVLLKTVAIDLDIPPPPTLELFIHELPPAPQRAYFQKATDQHSETGEESVAAVSGPPPGMEPPPDMDMESPSGSGLPPGMEDTPVPNAEMETPEDETKVDRGVLSALSRQDQAPVIVILKEPKRTPGESQEQLVARSQQSVLDTLSPEEFKLKRRFDAVFSFAGWINIDGFMKLQINPNVKQIVLDDLASPH